MMTTKTRSFAILALAASLCFPFENAPAQSRSEQLKVLLEKDGTASVGGKAVAIASLGQFLKQRDAKKILVREKPGFGGQKQVEEALRTGGVELATYIDEKGDTLFRIRYDQKKPASPAAAAAAASPARDEMLKLVLVKGGVVIGDETVPFADLAEALKKRKTSHVAINTTPAEGAGDDPMLLTNALSAGGVREALFERATGEIQAVMTFAQEGEAKPKPAEPVKIYRVKEKVEIDGKLFTNAELAAELKRRNAESVLIYLKEPGCVGEDAIAFGRALADSGIGVAEFRDAQDRPQALRVFKDEFRNPPGGGAPAAQPQPKPPGAVAPPAAPAPAAGN